MPEPAEFLHERIRAAVDAGSPLRIRGGGSKDFYGGPLQGDILDTGDYRGIVDYDPPELVVTARCGTPLAEIEDALAEKGQMLPFEPPYFSDTATIGGCVAAGLSGPRRASAGAVRDLILGATILSGQGEVLRFGGRVMKNVAGYDIARLMSGSLGTLGLILDVSIKVLPISPATVTLRGNARQSDALEQFCRWAGQPIPVSATAWVDGELFLRLSGAHAAVEKATRALSLVEVPESDAPWSMIREQTHPFFNPDRVLIRCALPAHTPPLRIDAPTLIEWNGQQRWLSVSPHSPDQVESAFAEARRLGGHASVFRRHDGIARFPFDDLDEATFAIHQRLKDVFDPHRIFNPGRLHSKL